MILKSVWIYACNTDRYTVTLILGYGLYLSNKYALYAPSKPTYPFRLSVFSMSTNSNAKVRKSFKLPNLFSFCDP
jgi:hypothetical protein